jgi:hypothetical protein
MLKTRIEYMDVEYINGIYDEFGNQVMRPLTPEEKDWLDKFYKEYYCASFNHENCLHKSKNEKRNLYNANNARNRCIYNLKNAIHTLKPLNDESYNPAHNTLVGFKTYIENLNDSEIDLKLKTKVKKENKEYYDPDFSIKKKK